MIVFMKFRVSRFKRKKLMIGLLLLEISLILSNQKDRKNLTHWFIF